MGLDGRKGGKRVTFDEVGSNCPHYTCSYLQNSYDLSGFDDPQIQTDWAVQQIQPVHLELKMMISTSSYLNPDPPSATTQKLNSIKLDFSKIAFAPTSSHEHTACKHCGAILTEEDRKMAVKMKDKVFLWCCRFCKKENESTVLLFVENNYKYVIQKNLKSKITPPILLFVIDNSGSMYQSIFYNLKYGTNPHVISKTKKEINPLFIDMIVQSTLYRREQALTTKIQNSFTEIIKKQKYAEEEISKIVLLYAVVEYNLKLLAKKAQKTQCRVGFIFFSDMIYVLKGAKQKEIPVYVHQGELCHEEWPFQKKSVDFENYETLFQAGTSYEKYFGDSRLHNFDVGKVAVNRVKGGGRTALGPALALAMGIISMHDQGSRIIVATDSQPNFGLLSMGDSDFVYKKMGNCLEQNGAILSILKWTGDEGGKNKEEESFAKFKRVYQDYVEQTELNLQKCKGKDSIELSITSLNKLINKEPLGHSCSVKTLCDNPKVTPQRLKFDSLDYQTIRFFNSNSKCWFTLNMDRLKLQQYDYLFPVVTQTITTYADIFTKQRYLYMSYTKQLIAKPTQLKHPQEENEEEEVSFASTVNLNNLNELCDLELISLYEQRKEQADLRMFDKQELKTNFKYKDIEVEKDVRSQSDLAMIKNKLYQEPEEEGEEDEQFQKL